MPASFTHISDFFYTQFNDLTIEQFSNLLLLALFHQLALTPSIFYTFYIRNLFIKLLFDFSYYKSEAFVILFTFYLIFWKQTKNNFYQHNNNINQNKISNSRCISNNNLSLLISVNFCFIHFFNFYPLLFFPLFLYFSRTFCFFFTCFNYFFLSMIFLFDNSLFISIFMFAF